MLNLSMQTVILQEANRVAMRVTLCLWADLMGRCRLTHAVLMTILLGTFACQPEHMNRRALLIRKADGCHDLRPTLLRLTIFRRHLAY